MIARHWLLPAGADSKVLTGQQMQAGDVHPLRCVYLGRMTEAEAIEAARKIALDLEPATVIARNVRTACDRRQTRRWRLSEQEIDLLRAGHVLRIEDRIGTFVVKYSARS